MAGIPKVKIQFDADLDGLKKGSKAAENEVSSFGDKVGEFGKKAAAAFAVAAAAAVAYAGKLAVDGVRAAIADEQAQLRLATALGTATGATNAQIKAVEDQILKTSLATGVADDELRPALQRLAVATGDTSKAQDLLSVALDVAAATGKPLQAVTSALGKAYEGNTTALGKLGVGISATEAKTIGFTGSVEKLTDLYGGSASRNAETFQGRIDRIKVAFDETKESIGQALLPIVEKLLGFITTTVLPAFQKLSDSLSGSGDGILKRFTDIYNYARDFVTPIFEAIRSAFVKIGDAIKDKKPELESIITTFKDIYTWANTYIIPILKTGLVQAIETFASAASKAIKVVVPVVETVFNSIKSIVNGIIDVVNTAISIYNKANNLIPGSKDINPIGKIGEGTLGVGLGNRPLGGGTSTATGAAAALGGAGGGGSLATTIGSAVGAGVGKAVKDLPKTLIEEVTAENAFKLIPPSDFDVAKFRKGEEKSMLPAVVDAPTFDPARARQGEEKGNTINVTINDAFDPESVARKLVDVLNDSNARGTLGGGGLFGLVAS